MLSCTSKKASSDNIKNIYYHQSIDSTSNLSEVELNIVNDFLEVELNTDRYKSYKNFNFFVIEEADKKIKPIQTYLYAYNEWLEMNKIDNIKDTENRWILDRNQIQKLNLKLESEKQYYWKITDFKKIQVDLLKHSAFREIIKSGQYINLPNRLIIRLSTPLIIDDKNALISFDIGNGNLGYSEISNFTVLMNKFNGKWIVKTNYYDGAFQ